MGKIHYPRLEVNLDKILNNTKTVTAECQAKGIYVAGVVKGCNALKEVVETLIKGGCHQIASSRISQLKRLNEEGVTTDKLLLRIPMLSELEDVIDYSDISLNSDKNTLIKLNDLCLKKKKMHRVILMQDLGDLREGLWSKEEMIELASFVENNLSNILLSGVGTNLGCYGSIRPTKDKMQLLADIAENIETVIGRDLEFVSGGATSSYPLVLSDTMPEKINHLRIGENILLCKDLTDYFMINMHEMHRDTFRLSSQIIEIEEKPSYPVGEIFVDAFGNKPDYEDIGIRKRAIVAIGKQEFGDHTKLIPTDDGIEIVGSSSDHLILDITKSKKSLHVGDVISFDMYYQSMLYSCLNEDVKKVFI